MHADRHMHALRHTHTHMHACRCMHTHAFTHTHTLTDFFLKTFLGCESDVESKTVKKKLKSNFLTIAIGPTSFTANVAQK